MPTDDGSADQKVVWTPGMTHPEYKVVAAESEGHWIPIAGYKWADDPPVISNLVWNPGQKHPDKNLVAGREEGSWEPAPGYSPTGG